jgi:trk system potassium uptake protein TrkH
MTFATVQRVIGVFLALFSLTMLPPIAVSGLFGDATWNAFAISFLVIALLGFLLWLPVRRGQRDLRLRDGFIVVALFWLVLGTFGALPLLLVETPAMTFTDAVFESMAGLTTTGATVLVGLDSMPPAVLYYRHQLQWFGGLGLIVLAVAVLPMLGVGGMQLYRAEMPGPIKDNKLTPRITQTAKALWYVYLGITIACAVAYWTAGMSVFDAVCHSFSTVAIGGFSTHDASIGYFDNAAVETIAIVFMVLAGANFTLHFLAWRDKSVMHYWADSEFRAYCKFLLGLTVMVVGYLVYAEHYATSSDALRRGLFQVVSMGTTTGYTTARFDEWPGALPILLIYASFVGGCAGSTAGGMKVIRWLLMYKQGAREVSRLVHPSAEIPVKLGGYAVHGRVVDSVWGFFAIYIVVFAALMLILLSAELDPISAFAAVASTLNNLGPGLGTVAQNFVEVTTVAKWASVCAMLLGRLEIFTLLVLITPTFWRR